VLAGCGGANEAEEEAAVAAARAAYVKAKAEGEDLSSGPCLGTIMANWVADVAHDPRQAVDDRPENQCEAYRSGEAEHFVELGACPGNGSGRLTGVTHHEAASSVAPI
jgi:hypothetical protein